MTWEIGLVLLCFFLFLVCLGLALFPGD